MKRFIVIEVWNDETETLSYFETQPEAEEAANKALDNPLVLSVYRFRRYAQGHNV